MMVNLTLDKSHPIVTFDVSLTDEGGTGEGGRGWTEYSMSFAFTAC